MDVRDPAQVQHRDIMLGMTNEISVDGRPPRHMPLIHRGSTKEDAESLEVSTWSVHAPFTWFREGVNDKK